MTKQQKRLGDPDIEVKREFFEALQCPLTEADLAAIARKIGAKRREVQELEAKRDETVDRMKSLINGAKAQQDELAEAAASGVELRQVKCAEAFFWRTSTVVVKRADTGAVISERPMTPEERQVRMPWDGIPSKNPPKEKKAKSSSPPSAEPKTPPQLLPAEHDREDGPTVDDPQGILDGDAGEGKPEAKKGKRGKKGGKR